MHAEEFKAMHGALTEVVHIHAPMADVKKKLEKYGHACML